MLQALEVSHTRWVVEEVTHDSDTGLVSGAMVRITDSTLMPHDAPWHRTDNGSRHVGRVLPLMVFQHPFSSSAADPLEIGTTGWMHEARVVDTDRQYPGRPGSGITHDVMWATDNEPVPSEDELYKHLPLVTVEFPGN